MKLLNLDWVEMIDLLHMWDDLRQKDQDFFPGRMEPGTVPADTVQVETADQIKNWLLPWGKGR
jgi:hypothetical protein